MIQPRLALAGPSRTASRLIPSFRALHADGRQTAIPAHATSGSLPGNSTDSGTDPSLLATSPPPPPSPAAVDPPKDATAGTLSSEELDGGEYIRAFRESGRRAWGKDGLPYVRNKQKQWIPQYRPPRKTRVWMPDGHLEPPMWPITQEWQEKQEREPTYHHPLWKFFNLPRTTTLAVGDPSMPRDGYGSVVNYNEERSSYHPTRSWDVNELRIKSFSDLHILWYILLRERNVLLTQDEERRRMLAQGALEDQPALSRRKKQVQVSMRNIKVVLNERRLGFMAAESPYLRGEGGHLDVQLPRWVDPQNSLKALSDQIDVPEAGTDRPVRKRRYSERRSRRDAAWTYRDGKPVPSPPKTDNTPEAVLMRQIIAHTREVEKEHLRLAENEHVDSEQPLVPEDDLPQRQEQLAKQVAGVLGLEGLEGLPTKEDIEQREAATEGSVSLESAMRQAARFFSAEGSERHARIVQGAADLLGLDLSQPHTSSETDRSESVDRDQLRQAGYQDDGGKAGPDAQEAAVPDEQVSKAEVEARDEGFGGGKEAKEFDEDVKVDEAGHVKKKD